MLQYRLRTNPGQRMSFSTEMLIGDLGCLTKEFQNGSDCFTDFPQLLLGPFTWRVAFQLTFGFSWLQLLECFPPKGHWHRCRVLSPGRLTLRSKQSMNLRALHLVNFRNPGGYSRGLEPLIDYMTKHKWIVLIHRQNLHRCKTTSLKRYKYFAVSLG